MAKLKSKLNFLLAFAAGVFGMNTVVAQESESSAGSSGSAASSATGSLSAGAIAAAVAAAAALAAAADSDDSDTVAAAAPSQHLGTAKSSSCTNTCATSATCH